MARDWMNKELDEREFSNRQPALTADVIKPANATVLTITDIDIIMIPDSERSTGNRAAVKVMSREYPEHVWWPNFTSIVIMKEQLGKKPAQWKGGQVPLVVMETTNPRTGDEVKTLQAAPSGEWTAMLRSFKGSGRSGSGRKTTGKNAAKKSARKGR